MFSACEDKDDSPNLGDAVGTWELVGLTGTYDRKVITKEGAKHSADAYPALIVTTASMKYTWAEEIEKWLPGKTFKVLNGGKALGKYGDTDFTIITYDILTKHVGQIEHAEFKGAILDESHKIKSRDAKRTRSAFSI